MKISTVLVLAMTVWFCADARAVLVYNGTASNLSAPVLNDPGWEAVASIYLGSPGNGPGTASFLGNQGGYAWFLTANHVTLGGATLSIGNSTYSVFSGIQQIGSVDLKVFRLDTTVSGITPVTLASSVPAVNASVTMIGYGKNGTKTTWDIPGGNTTWTSPGADASGYDWSGSNVKRWGKNTVAAHNVVSGSGNLIVTDFSPLVDEAQGSVGDSGGAVFHKNGLQWELSAVMIAVGRLEGGTLYIDGFAGQPGSTSVYSISGSPNDRSVTYSVQIADYKNLILEAIPEPAPVTLLLGLAILALRKRRGADNLVSCNI